MDVYCDDFEPVKDLNYSLGSNIADIGRNTRRKDQLRRNKN
jgi:hypothetical protein